MNRVGNGELTLVEANLAFRPTVEVQGSLRCGGGPITSIDDIPHGSVDRAHFERSFKAALISTLSTDNRTATSNLVPYPGFRGLLPNDITVLDITPANITVTYVITSTLFPDGTDMAQKCNTAIGAAVTDPDSALTQALGFCDLSNSLPLSPA